MSDRNSDGFERELRSWVDEALLNQGDAQKTDAKGWTPLNGDAGFRRYFRIVLDRSSVLAVYAPPETENNAAFLQIDEFLYRHGVHVPKIVAHDLGRGFFLIEDLGESLYLDVLNQDNVNMLYGEALFSLLRIQQSPRDSAIFPLYDQTLLKQEMQFFSHWFVESMLGLPLSSEGQGLLDMTFAMLVESAQSQPEVVVHRDFHSRNIVCGSEGTPGIIDFQDAVIGPVTYDLVSLLRDCYIRWPRDQVISWALAYGSMAVDAGIIVPVSEKTFLRWFDLMGLQRHIKVLGIFARLSLRDGKHGYLADLPLVTEYVREVAADYDELSPFLQWFDSQLMPRINEQSWMTNHQ